MQVPLSLVRVLAYGQGNILICAVHDHASAHSPQVPRTAAPFIDTHIDYLSYVSTHTHCLQVPRTATPFIDTHFVYILCLHSHLLPTGSTHKYPFHWHRLFCVRLCLHSQATHGRYVQVPLPLTRIFLCTIMPPLTGHGCHAQVFLPSIDPFLCVVL